MNSKAVSNAERYRHYRIERKSSTVQPIEQVSLSPLSTSDMSIATFNEILSQLRENNIDTAQERNGANGRVAGTSDE